MDVSLLLDGLNPAQREAVTAPDGGALILAGAGSGKTRVLVHRIAWVIEVLGASPWSIFAVTFTNKAAHEMRGRIEALIGHHVAGMWVGTFHGLAHRLLRAHWQEAGLPKEFQIMDSDDQLRAIKRVLRAMQLDEARWPPRQVQGFINARKEEGLRPQHLDTAGDFYLTKMKEVYAAYQRSCDQSGQVDFSELLLRAHELWRDQPTVLEHYRDRFHHILVDEFQDTNAIQYAWLRLLAGPRSNIFAVGDDDQSIYGWRGAKVENLQFFSRDYPAAGLVRLEQNYRSTQTILTAANALIANNESRLGKNLWTDYGEGEPIEVFAAFNETEEAGYVIDRIRQLLGQGGLSRSECAILYRTSAQSRQFEEALVREAIPYRVYGGQRFYDRAEIKDALAYLRLVANPEDDGAFERIVNHPPRGIGAATLDQLRAQALAEGRSMWTMAHQAVEQAAEGAGLSTRAANALKKFIELMAHLGEGGSGPLDLLAKTVIRESGLPEHFKKQKDGKGEDRVENLEELVAAAHQFEKAWDATETTALIGFLSHTALESGDTQAADFEDSIQLMTLHSAKGLEFPVVFLSGLEEERRLCYVGITRAMRRLILTRAESRFIHGESRYGAPSRFLRELPKSLLRQVRPGSVPGLRRAGAASSSMSTDAPGRAVKEPQEGGLHLGQRVAHPKFGEGIVVNAEGRGASARVQVNFEEVGSKWLVLAFANLTPL